MVTNPMQRKARNSFLLGMLVMLLISAVIIVMLIMQIVKAKEQEEQLELSQVEVCVLKTDVVSGQIITPDMLTIQTVLATTAPANAVTDFSEFVLYSLKDKKTGNTINSDNDGNLFVIENGVEVPIIKKGEDYQKLINCKKDSVTISSSDLKRDTDGNLYINENQEKVLIIKKDKKYYKITINEYELVEFMDIPLMAKVDMQANSVVTLDLIAKSNEIASNDLRLQEYNMISLPVKVNVDDYIDIRFTLPSGQDYIVVSKKRVVEVMENTVWLKLAEEEIITLNNAIYEAYTMPSSKIYANIYVEPGLQEASEITYPINSEVWELVNSNPNIVTTAKRALAERLQSLSAQRNNMINSELQNYEEDALSNIETKILEENERRQELRDKYLEELAGATTGVIE